MVERIKLFTITEELRKNILKVYGRDKNSLNEDVEAIKKWVKTQPHLPEIPDNKRIETFLILNKFSVERTKEKLDMYYTIRSLIPDLYQNVNPKLPHMQQIVDVLYWIPLPRLTPDFYRVIVFKFRDLDVDKFNLTHFFAHVCNVAEVRVEEDMVIGDICLYDLAGFKAGHLKKITPVMISKINSVSEKVFSSRLAALHFINCPTFIDIFITMIKSVVKQKIANRIHVHKDWESLNEHFPKELLPKDYGGEETALCELNEAVKEALVRHQARFDLLDGMRVDENLRPQLLNNDDLLGFHGNFKKLSVD